MVMESFEDSNCRSMSDSFSLYERYMRSFNVVDTFREQIEPDPVSLLSNCDYENPSIGGNIDLSAAVQTSIKEDSKHYETAQVDCVSLGLNENTVEKGSLIADISKIGSPCTSLAPSLNESSSLTVDHNLTDKSDPADVPVSSDESKFSCFKQPIFITSTMENSNNAVDMLRDVRHSESVFKLPISELSFNGTIKHVQKLKPIVDPITALTANAGLVLDEKSQESDSSNISENIGIAFEEKSCHTPIASDISDERSTKGTESTGDSQYEDFSRKESLFPRPEDKSTKWSNDQSYSSLEASFDSGVRSPDMFCSDDEDAEASVAPEPFWSFLKNYEQHDKKKVKKMEEKLQGILPPPSVTTLRTDVTEMLKKYYCFLPAFNNEVKVDPEPINPVTPTKRVSFVEIPTVSQVSREEIAVTSTREEKPEYELDTSANDKSIVLEMSSEVEAKETTWPNLLKCRHYDVYYNVTTYSEKMEMLALRYGERYVGAETETSVNVYSGGNQSPSSAHKRKALRLKMAQAKSPGRRLSHLARRRQAFCSAATINEKAQAGTAKMVLIDKNYFPHRKLINSAERKSPRLRRTPGKKTPSRKTPGKKTPAKTPKTRSGGSSRKKIMRRLLMDSDSMTRSQPTRETLKRALFVSPENRKSIPSTASTSVPLQAMKSKRALFSSPDRSAETKSADGTQSDHFLKRKLDALDDQPENSRNKIAKSLSFGGDTIGSMPPHIMNRRASEVFTRRNSVELNETHKKKLLWAVSEALRVHGWRMSSAGFREKAEALARLTRRLLTLPPHAAKFASPKLSTSETMLKLARQYVFAIIQGRSIEDCFQEEQMKLANDGSSKLSGYISANAYQQFKARQAAPSTLTSQIKENCNGSFKQDQPRSGSKNVLQDKLINVDSSSNSSSGFSMLDKSGLYKSNSMPSFEEAAKMRARRQISFDNLDFPKR